MKSVKHRKVYYCELLYVLDIAESLIASSHCIYTRSYFHELLKYSNTEDEISCDFNPGGLNSSVASSGCLAALVSSYESTSVVVAWVTMAILLAMVKNPIKRLLQTLFFKKTHIGEKKK